MTGLKTQIIGMFAAFIFTGPAAAAVAPGAPAPDFTLTDTEGNEVSLGDYAGKRVVLEWTNHLCPFVQKHYNSGNMQALQKDLTAKGVVWLSIISSAPGKQGHVSPEKANELTEKRSAAPAAVLLDPSGDVGRAYGAKTTPHMYLIDPEGKIVYMGAIDDKPTTDKDDIPTAKNFVRAAFTALDNGEPVETNYHRPYGCSVKY